MAEKRVFQGDGGAETQIFDNLANHKHKATHNPTNLV
jgi:hypothetical protein